MGIFIDEKTLMLMFTVFSPWAFKFRNTNMAIRVKRQECFARIFLQRFLFTFCGIPIGRASFPRPRRRI